MKKLGKTFEIILFILLLVVVIFTIYSIIQTNILKKDYVNFFGYTAFEVITGSMSDTIEIGDIVIVKIIHGNDISLDDIIVFKEEGIITHRVIEINEDIIITKGDANNAKDKPITRDMVLGKVTKILPKVGIIKKVITTPVVYISIFTTLILFWITFSYDKKDKKTKGKHYA